MIKCEEFNILCLNDPGEGGKFHCGEQFLQEGIVRQKYHLNGFPHFVLFFYIFCVVFCFVLSLGGKDLITEFLE